MMVSFGFVSCSDDEDGGNVDASNLYGIWEIVRDQGYFYDWEKFSNEKELNEKLKVHLAWSNRKPMRTLGGKSPLELLQEKLAAA